MLLLYSQIKQVISITCAVRAAAPHGMSEFLGYHNESRRRIITGDNYMIK
jgi:hypothetical protein